MKDDRFKEFLKQKKSFKIDEDFDKKTMSIIRTQVRNESKSRIYLKLMYLFFVLALTLGLLIAFNQTNAVFSLSPESSFLDNLPFAVPVILLLAIFERLYKVTIEREGVRTFS